VPLSVIVSQKATDKKLLRKLFISRKLYIRAYETKECRRSKGGGGRHPLAGVRETDIIADRFFGLLGVVQQANEPSSPAWLAASDIEFTSQRQRPATSVGNELLGG
jgi:hypothetical protein